MCVRGAASTNSTTRTGWWLLARLLKDRACMIRLSAVFFIYLSLHSVAKFERAEVNDGGKKDFEGYSILFLTRWCILSINANPCEKKIKRFLAKNFNHSFKEYTTGFFFFLSLLINFRLFGNPVAETWSGFFAIRIDWFFFLPWKGKGTCSVHFLVHLIDGWSLFAVDLWISQKKGKEKSHAAKNRITGRTRICLLLLSTCFFSQ